MATEGDVNTAKVAMFNAITVLVNAITSLVAIGQLMAQQEAERKRR